MRTPLYGEKVEKNLEKALKQKIRKNLFFLFTN